MSCKNYKEEKTLELTTQVINVKNLDSFVLLTYNRYLEGDFSKLNENVYKGIYLYLENKYHENLSESDFVSSYRESLEKIFEVKTKYNYNLSYHIEKSKIIKLEPNKYLGIVTTNLIGTPSKKTREKIQSKDVLIAVSFDYGESWQFFSKTDSFLEILSFDFNKDELDKIENFVNNN